MKPCSRQALTFERQPQIMTLNDTIVWDNLKNKSANHLSKQIKWAFSSLEPNYQPQLTFLPKYITNACNRQNSDLF